MKQIHFELESEDRQRYPLPTLPCTIGRGADCDLVVDLDRISRRHARLEASNDGLLVIDLESTNGTFINHDRISIPTLLRPGDRVHLANHAFTLRHADEDLELSLAESDAGSTPGGNTVVGFTALPTGFPVQAPEFFELLNDEQVQATGQHIKTAGGTLLAVSLDARSRHPDLNADAAKLDHLAEQLGEEVRLAELARRICVEQAEKAGIQASLLVRVHPLECEEVERLLDLLENLAREHRHLALVFDFPIATTADGTLKSARERLSRLGAELCGRIDEPLDTERLGRQAKNLSYARLPASGGPELVSKVAAIVGTNCRILVDGVDQQSDITILSEAGASLFQGAAVGAREDI